MRQQEIKPQNDVYREMVERYCHVVDSNVPVCRYTENGKTVFECSKRAYCEKNGGCHNNRYR